VKRKRLQRKRQRRLHKTRSWKTHGGRKKSSGRSGKLSEKSKKRNVLVKRPRSSGGFRKKEIDKRRLSGSIVRRKSRRRRGVRRPDKKIKRNRNLGSRKPRRISCERKRSAMPRRRNGRLIQVFHQTCRNPKDPRRTPRLLHPRSPRLPRPLDPVSHPFKARTHPRHAPNKPAQSPRKSLFPRDPCHRRSRPEPRVQPPSMVLHSTRCCLIPSHPRRCPLSAPQPDLIQQGYLASMVCHLTLLDCLVWLLGHQWDLNCLHTRLILGLL
jgi:hypothetical protein